MGKLDNNLLKYIEKNYETAKNLADYITDNPECGSEEKLACAYYVKLLEENGYEVEAPVADVPYSFRAVHKSRVNHKGKKAVFMCEYDALPELGHACGHSVSGAASFLAAIAINEAYPESDIRMDILGTPAEEYPGGKVMLADKGIFNDYEFAIMAHMLDYNCAGFPILACNDKYITFHGKPSHASALPEKGLNALNAARIFMDAMDMWRQHLPKYNQIHGVVVKGGDLPSIVPSKVELNYYFRAKDLASLDALTEKAENCAKGAALCTGCTYEFVQQYLTYADLSNPPQGIELLEEIFKDLNLKTQPIGEPGGSSDAGNVDYIIPTFHPLVSVSAGKTIPIHSPEFAHLMKQDSAYEALKNSAILISEFALRLSNDMPKLEAIKAWHKEFRGL